MRAKLQELIYRGIWRGLGKMYNTKVENEYTTIIVKLELELERALYLVRE